MEPAPVPELGALERVRAKTDERNSLTNDSIAMPTNSATGSVQPFGMDSS